LPGSRARGKLLVFMDDDAQALPGFLAATWSFHQNYPSIAGFGGKIIPRFIPGPPGWMSYYVSSLVDNFDYGTEIKKFASNKYPLKSNMAILRRRLMNLVGLTRPCQASRVSCALVGRARICFSG